MSEKCSVVSCFHAERLIKNNISDEKIACFCHLCDGKGTVKTRKTGQNQHKTALGEYNFLLTLQRMRVIIMSSMFF